MGVHLTVFQTFLETTNFYLYNKRCQFPLSVVVMLWLACIDQCLTSITKIVHKFIIFVI